MLIQPSPLIHEDTFQDPRGCLGPQTEQTLHAPCFVL